MHVIQSPRLTGKHLERSTELAPSVVLQSRGTTRTITGHYIWHTDGQQPYGRDHLYIPLIKLESSAGSNIPSIKQGAKEAGCYRR